MRMTHPLTPAAIRAFAMLVMACPALAQERSAQGTLDSEVTWSALKAQIAQAETKAQASLAIMDAIKTCGNKQMLYAPSHTSKDAQGCVRAFDPRELTLKNGTFQYYSCGSGSHSCAPDQTTINHICKINGYAYAVGVGVTSYKSPKNNWIGRWTGSSWQVFNARSDNRFVTSISCQSIDWK